MVVSEPRGGERPAWSGSFSERRRRSQIQVVPVRLRVAIEVERAIEAFARRPNSGLIVLPDAADASFIGSGSSRWPSAFASPRSTPTAYYATEGGLMSYGIDANDIYRKAAPLVDRILKGEKPADIPVRSRPPSSSS